ncbi:GNAT family N-acetyltransferase [Pseudonocardia nematodicida]|uniref:GNAT family N-acetyltransferase n=1 Tax=Pseudonocardia nematodicida TaxID=1206997 RepID=A0ABV1K7M7_9PSEU
MADLPTVPPELTDGVVTLRGLRDSDVDDIVAVYRDPEMHRWTSLGPDHGEHDAREWLERVATGWREGTGFVWAIEAAGPDGRPRFAGQIDLRTGPPPSVGYGLAPWARGAGRMSRALRLAADWGFDRAGLRALHWDARAGHVASWRVAHACGFRFEGVRTAAIPAGGELVDAWTAVLLPGDPVATREPRTTWWTVPVLDGERGRLRPPVESDVHRQVEACNDPDAQWWNATLPRPYTADDARRWICDRRLDASLGRAVEWVIADPGDDRLLGTISVHEMDLPYTPTGGDVGYRAHPDARGRGIVTEALRLVIAHAFTPVDDGGLGRTRLALGAARDNAASRRVAERTGFQLVGEFRADGVHGLDNEHVDDGVWYDLLDTDPRPGPSTT